MRCSIAAPRRPRRSLGLLPLLLALAMLPGLLTLLPPQPAAAQTAGNSQRAATQRTARAAIRRSLRDAIAPPEASQAGIGITTTAQRFAAVQEPPPDWSFDTLLPLFLNTNPAQGPVQQPSFEVTPEARLSWSRRWDGLPVRFSALADASIDRFSRHDVRAAADANIMTGRLRAQYESGTDDQEWQPFTGFLPTSIWSPGFARRLDVWQDIQMGVSKGWAWDRNGRRVARAEDAEDHAAWVVNLTLAASRRFREAGPGSWATLFNPSVTWTPRPHISASVELDLWRRWYDPFDTVRRRDWLAIGVITLEYVPAADSVAPHWLGGPVFDLQVFLAKQRSNLAFDDFRQAGVGPIFRTAWKF